jgi:probable rRNA maturation factor
MPINLQEDQLVLSLEDIERLWQVTRAWRDYPDDDVNIKTVSEEEMRTLNMQYRGKDAPTNVLTFSYEGEHDVALCLDVAREEAGGRGAELRDYTALLLTHAFLHVTGMDHERSEREAQNTEEAERKILRAAGFSAATLAH